jgi:hypothetical protein
MVQDTLRGPTVGAIGIYDSKKVVALLDSLPGMDDASRTRFDPVLMYLLSYCLLHERFSL